MKKDIRYVPTPPLVVQGMLELANVTRGDVFFDLGCGDGRLVIAAAQRGAQGLGVDIDLSLVERSRVNAEAAGVTASTEFRHGNFFQADLGRATVVALYLFPKVNRALLPKLLAELAPGTRIVSHSFDMGDWQPDQVLEVDCKLVYLWTLP